MRDRWLVLVLVLAAALRAYGLDHGLPFVYNPDEANIMARALSVARDPNPHYFLYPSFFFYVLFAVLGGLFVVGRLVGRYPSLEAFETRFFVDPTDFYLAGRLVGVVAALATIVLTYRVADRHCGRAAARAAAAVLAVVYFHVRDAHYLKHDVPAGLLVLLALVAYERALARSTPRAYAVAGLATGVAFATHYYTIFLAPTFLAYHVAVEKGLRLGRMALAGAVSAATFFLLSPFVVLDLPVALEHMGANRQVVVDRSLAAGALLPSLSLYVRFVLEQGLGYLLAGLVVAGAAILVRSSWTTAVLWGTFPLTFGLFLTYTHFAGRYLNPMAPSLVLVAAVAIGSVAKRWGGTTAAALTAVACAQPLYYAVQVDRLFAAGDTRSLARQWILDHVPDGTTIALQSYSVPLPQSAASIEESLAANGALDELGRKGKYFHLLAVARRSAPAYRLVFLGRGEEKNRLYLDYEDVVREELEPLVERGVRYVVLRHGPGLPPPPVAGVFEAVARRARLVHRVVPFRPGAPLGRRVPYLDNEDWPPSAWLAHKGPVVEIWALAGS